MILPTSSIAQRPRVASTLVEMLVTLALLGIISSVVTLAIRPRAIPNPDDPTTIITDTLMAVMRSGRAATLVFTIEGRPAFATVNPDGSIVADSVLRIERFTGLKRDVR